MIPVWDRAIPCGGPDPLVAGIRVADKDLKLNPEVILAHRETVGAGTIIAAATTVWQRPDFINRRFSIAFEVEPIDEKHHAELADLWQIRHISAHSSGVTTELDCYRIKTDLEPRRALQITDSYLEMAEGLLMGIVDDGVHRVGERILSDFFDRTPRVNWPTDRQEFEKLYLIGQVVSQTRDIPEVTEETFISERGQRLGT